MGQEHLPGTEPEHHPDLVSKAKAVLDLCLRRKDIGEELKAAKEDLIACMGYHKLPVYEYGGIRVEVDELSKVKVKETKGGDDGDD